MFKIPEYCNLNLRMSRVVSSDRSMKEWHRGFWEFSGRCGELQIREQQIRMRSILWFLSAVVRSENRPHLSCIGAVDATTVQICFYGPSWRLEFTWTRNFCFFKMPAKMGINGFGRIGRLVFRAAMANPEVEVYFFMQELSARSSFFVSDCAPLGLECLWMICRLNSEQARD